ncbi:hypothetical protein A3Q56_03716 [Intoshia linei]|uniref:Uncharacterized protein n=1 Tax=Intoshia linei TaxID=1819745 RepID=A0A177B558_9BILA|nr:hypothetical protein A3Q56_03716 [Intoshia linei]
MDRKNYKNSYYTHIHSNKDSMYFTDDDSVYFDFSNLKQKYSWRSCDKKKCFTPWSCRFAVNDVSNVVVYFDSKKIDINIKLLKPGEMIKRWNILKTITLTMSRIVEFSLTKFMLHQDYLEANMDEVQQGSSVNDTAERTLFVFQKARILLKK